VRYRIYYSDGTTYDGTVETVPQAPPTGVQVIVQFDDYSEHWYMQSGSDNYIWRDGRWVGVDDTGRTVYLVTPGWKRVLFGETIRTERWLQAFNEAIAYRNKLDQEHVRPG
jgi:hypothetical protein